MIDGLKLTVTGEDLRRLLQERADAHRASAAHWSREAARKPDEQTEDAPLLPAALCENEAEREEWRARVIEFLRDHLDPSEVYRLGQSDLEVGELLPPKPEWLEQEEQGQQFCRVVTLRR
jgi:hypothetical protein